MHAVLVTFRSSAPPATLIERCARHAEAMQAVLGLVMKTWLHDGETLGGFHLFSTRASADEYLASDPLADLAAHGALATCTVRHFAVMEAPSRLTGTPQPLGG